MRKVKIFAVSVIMATSLHSCYSMNMQPSEGVSSAQEISSTIEQYDYENAQNLEKYTGTRLKEIDIEIGRIQGQLNSADSQTKKTLQSDLEELKAQKNFLENQVSRLNDVSETEWDRFKVQISGLFQSFLESFTDFQIKLNAALDKEDIFDRFD